MWLLRKLFFAVLFGVKTVFVFTASVSLLGVYLHAIHLKQSDEIAFAFLVAPGCLIVFWTFYRTIFECARSARFGGEWRSIR